MLGHLPTSHRITFRVLFPKNTPSRRRRNERSVLVHLRLSTVQYSLRQHHLFGRLLPDAACNSGAYLGALWPYHRPDRFPIVVQNRTNRLLVGCRRACSHPKGATAMQRHDLTLARIG